MTNQKVTVSRQFRVFLLACFAVSVSACSSSGGDPVETVQPDNAENLTDTENGTPDIDNGNSAETGTGGNDDAGNGDTSAEMVADQTTTGEGGDNGTSGITPGRFVNGFIVTKSVHSDEQGTVTSEVRYTYDFEANSIFVDEVRLTDGVESFLASTAITYNDAGNLMQLNRLDEMGEINATSNFVYNDQGELLQIVSEAPGFDSSTETISYDNNANLVKREVSNTDTGEVSFTVNYTLREDGLPITQDIDGTTFSSTNTYQYDQNNRKARFNTDSISEEYLYDENDNIATRNNYGSDGALVSTRVYTYERTEELVYNAIGWFHYLYR